MSSGFAGMVGLVQVLGLFAILFAAYWAFKLLKKSSSYVYEKSKDKANEVISKRTVDNQYYALAEQEVTSGSIDAGLWAKALVNVKGNEDSRKAEYIKMRAKQLQKQNQS